MTTFETIHFYVVLANFHQLNQHALHKPSFSNVIGPAFRHSKGNFKCSRNHFAFPKICDLILATLYFAPKNLKKSIGKILPASTT